MSASLGRLSLRVRGLVEAACRELAGPTLAVVAIASALIASVAACYAGLLMQNASFLGVFGRIVMLGDYGASVLSLVAAASIVHRPRIARAAVGIASVTSVSVLVLGAALLAGWAMHTGKNPAAILIPLAVAALSASAALLLVHLVERERDSGRPARGLQAVRS